MILQIFMKNYTIIQTLQLKNNMQEQLQQYFRQKGIQLSSKLTPTQNIKQVFNQKQRIIQNLQQQLTKNKYELIKNQKLIKSLQDKINQLAPNISNTGSNFMMASQFKTHFEEFITTILPTSLSLTIDKPYLFSKCTSDIFLHTYESITQQLQIILNQVCQALRINHLKNQQKDLEHKVKLSILKILQQFWTTIFPYNQNHHFQYIDSSNQFSPQLLQELNELVINDQYAEMQRQLYDLCVYMVLQEKQWQFVNLNNNETIKFNKKQYNCIDGWIKEGSDALLLLGGLKKQGHIHPNLKNYVIPISEDDKPDYYTNIVLRIKQEMRQQEKPIPLKQKLSSPPKLDRSQQMQFQKEVQILVPVLQNSQYISKNKSIQFLNNKQNYPHQMNKKSKKKDKLKFSVDTSLNLQDKSPTNKIKQYEQSIKNKKCDQLVKNKKNQLDEVDSKIYLIKEQSRGKKKSLVVSKINDHIASIKQKDVFDFPMTKQPNPKKRPKANTSRKNSVGKIVNQNHIINSDKQNTQIINSTKMKNKEKVYKDIIKQKLLDEKIGDKTQYSLNILFPKSRTDREKKKEENRPLKIQNNTNKLRQKYIF